MNILIACMLALFVLSEIAGLTLTFVMARRNRRRDVLWVSPDPFPLTDAKKAANRRVLREAYRAAGLPDPIVIDVPASTSIKRDPAR